MRTSIHGPVIGIPISFIGYPLDQRSPMAHLTCTTSTTTQHNSEQFTDDASSAMKRSRVDSVLYRVNKLGKKAETVRSKLILGARILQFGGVEKIFCKLFCVKEGERLLKASQCCLSTTAGPISGLLFISTCKIAFCSQKTIKISSTNEEPIQALYKVVIPVNKIERVNEHENAQKSAQKYIEIVTVDKFDFWFMGFLNYKQAFKYLQQSLSRS